MHVFKVSQTLEYESEALKTRGKWNIILFDRMQLPSMQIRLNIRNYGWDSLTIFLDSEIVWCVCPVQGIDYEGVVSLLHLGLLSQSPRAQSQDLCQAVVRRFPFLLFVWDVLLEPKSGYILKWRNYTIHCDVMEREGVGGHKEFHTTYHQTRLIL